MQEKDGAQVGAASLNQSGPVLSGRVQSLLVGEHCPPGPSPGRKGERSEKAQTPYLLPIGSSVGLTIWVEGRLWILL